MRVGTGRGARNVSDDRRATPRIRGWGIGGLVVGVALIGSSALAQSTHASLSAAPPSSTGRPVAPGTYRLSVPTDTMLAVLREEMFTDSGRFYPCRINTACASWGNDVVVSAPNISVDGPRVTFSVHM